MCCRALLNNMVKGVSDGFSKTLQLNGVGYRATVDGSTIVLSLGYSHPVRIPIPEGIDVKVPSHDVLAASSCAAPASWTSWPLLLTYIAP